MIVTRFAPSPTGYLHVGGARTALFNWLLARRMGGKFLLRIEDTDVKRNTPTATAQVLEDLKWLGIDWDEGPDKDGPNGPYLQSQRLEIYTKFAHQLVDQGKAYYCFDTSEELDAMRKQAEAQKRKSIYPRPARFPDESDVKKAQSEGRPVTIRFAVDQSRPVIIQDEIRGQVQFDPAELGDFIIIKSDGFPTYHFAVVIDDQLMNVTHVIRGQEHLMNTPNHQLLQQALGFRTPVYAHLPVIVSEGGGKLSKRERAKVLKDAVKSRSGIDLAAMADAGGTDLGSVQSFLAGDSTPDMPVVDAMAAYAGVHLPEINIVDFLRSGYLPETLVNFLALLGWNPGDQREIMTVEEMTASFDLSRVNKSNSLFDRKKLLAFNTEHIKLCKPDKLLGYFKAYLKENNSPVAHADEALLARLLKVNEGARTLEQIEQKCRFAFMADDAILYDDEAVKKVLLKNDGLVMLSVIAEGLKSLPEVTAESIENLLRGIAEQKQVGLGKIAQPLRVALTGTTISPPIFDTVDILGLDRTLKRIALTITKFNS
ncbi:MAG TPA: glutamate--tRNA ligase [Anaerohalosphaeraceae bacterium]|nr:glutamate--tRNA ligase [Anaerohalosphaeraceae bacterium]